MAKFSDKVLEAALRKAGGVPAGAARILEQAFGTCARSTVTRRIAKSEKLQALIAELQEELIDISEISMAAMVRNAKHRNHFNAAKFVLETKGKSRGWSKQVEVSILTPVPIVFSPGQAALV
jgi:hypothetical protein